MEKGCAETDGLEAAIFAVLEAELSTVGSVVDIAPSLHPTWRMSPKIPAMNMFVLKGMNDIIIHFRMIR